MSDTQTAPERRAYSPRMSNAERQAMKQEALVASVQEPDAKLREIAARQAARVEPMAPVIVPDMVKVRILKLGDGRISQGLHVSGVGEVHYERNDTPTLERFQATTYEDRGWVEIIDE